MSLKAMPDARLVLDSISDGVYVTDRDRQIVYWSRSAERITGWQAADVVGKHCHDDVLCHIDKDGHRLCGEEYCPLHRAIVSGNQSTAPIIVFARAKGGHRVPMRVTVGPVLNADGEIIGGVETFHDLSEEIHDVERAKKIQSMSMRRELPPDDRIAFREHYISRDIVGGDFPAIARLSDDVYGFMLADVSGHGVAAALYTMFLCLLWETHKSLLENPAQFALAMSKSLCSLAKEDSPFAAALCGVVDLSRGTIRMAGAGIPFPLLFPSNKEPVAIPCKGLPFGVFEEARYSEVTVNFDPGDCLLLFSDGATEVTQKDGSMLETKGLLDCLCSLGYPRREVAMKDMEEAILRSSDLVRFNDDLTFLEISRSLAQGTETGTT